MPVPDGNVDVLERGLGSLLVPLELAVADLDRHGGVAGPRALSALPLALFLILLGGLRVFRS